MTFDEVVERLVLIERSYTAAVVRNNCAKWTDTVRDQIVEAASYLSVDALSFVYRYTDYYIATRGHKIIPTQFHWTVKYAIIIAPLVASLYKNHRYNSVFAGETVEYSFSSIRDRNMPDPADYDVHVLYGATILQLTKNRSSDIELARGVGEAWREVVLHWSDLHKKTGPQILDFVQNLKSGGAISLSSGLL